MIATPLKLMMIQEKSGDIINQTVNQTLENLSYCQIYKSDDELLFGKELYYMGINRENQIHLYFISLLNKEELKLVNIDLQRKKLLLSSLFSLPMEKKWISSKAYGRNRSIIACLK